MIVYGNPQEVEEYFADGSASQSYLKNLIKGVDFLGEDEESMYYKEKGHFLIGSAVDVWLTQGKEQYDEQYFTSECSKPSDTIMSIVKQIFDAMMFDDTPYDRELGDIGTGQILESLNYHKYQMRWKEPTRIQKVLDEGSEYFEELKAAHGKQVLSSKESGLVYSIVMSIKSGEYTADYFRDNQHVDVYFQVPIYFEFGGMPCKALLDMLRVDKAERTLEPVDVKTMSGFTIDFPWAVQARRYDFQGSFYTEGLLSLVRGESKCAKIHTDLTGFSIKPFKFIVETTHTVEDKLTESVRYFTGKPLVYELSMRQMKIGKEGRPKGHYSVNVEASLRTPKVPLRPIHGFRYALDLYSWHSVNGFAKDRSVEESQGVIVVE